jgi:hypothetical protein
MTYVDELLNHLHLRHKNGFFSCSFQRRTPAKVNGVIVAPAGTIRHMVCRLGVTKGTLGVVPPAVRRAEDMRCGVLTVWDVNVARKLREHHPDWDDFDIASNAYRRINLLGLVSLSCIENQDDLPPKLRPHWHWINNLWQRWQLAQQGIGPNGALLQAV